MGEGEEVKTKEEVNIDIQERGEIFIFYRPKVNKEEAESEDDVQRLYIVLRPESSSDDRPVELKQSSEDDDGGGGRRGGHGAEEVNVGKERLLMRLIVMGRKSLPGPQKSRPHWGFVELVTTDIRTIKNALQAEEYETSTRGHRHKPAARAMGEGLYRLLNHISDSSSSSSSSKMHTHLVYKLQLPTKTHHDDPNSPHHLLNVDSEASFLLQIKNPESTAPQFRGIQNKRKATFPATLQGQFGNRRYIPADPPDFLNYEGCELLFIPASDNIQKELGLELKTPLALSGEEDDKSSDEDEEESVAAKCSSFVHTFGEDCGLPTTPLFHGTWA